MKTLLSILLAIILQTSIAQVPQLRLIKKNKKPLKLTELKVDVVVIGNVATTTFDLNFYNPNFRDMEGELSMPLAQGQEISRYALDINGTLREGVIVEKVKARQAYEAVVQQKIDPGIVNLTKGNSFKTKVYPIPGKGEKRVVLAITETLTGDKDQLYYNLPIHNQDTIARFKLDVKVMKQASESLNIKSEFENTRFDKQAEASVMSFERENFKASEPLKFTIPRWSSETNHRLFTSDFEGKTYFYLISKAPKLKRAKKAAPKAISIYWDCSFSAKERDIEKELKLLEAYLKRWAGEKQITLIPFNYKAYKPVQFKIDQDATALLQHIKSLQNDGATVLDQLSLDSHADEILLFSDAVNTIGEDQLKTQKVPVYTISSALGSHYTLLKKTAQRSQGAFIDLNRLSVEQALDRLTYTQDQFISYTYNPLDIEEIYPQRPTLVGNYFEVSGILKTKQAHLSIHYGHAQKVTVTQNFELKKNHNALEVPVARIWASKKLGHLMFDYEHYKEGILFLSRKYNIITRNTSFIVLDRVEDYVAHKIIPPVELQKAYYRILSYEEEAKDAGDKHILEANLRRINMLKSWYDYRYIRPRRSERSASSQEQILEQEESYINNLEGTNYELSRLERRRDRYQSENESAELEIYEESFDISDVEEDNLDEVIEFRAPRRSFADSEPAEGQMGESVEQDIRPVRRYQKGKIAVLPWVPDAPYVEILRQVSEADFEATYQKLKQENLNRPAFYIQVADMLFKKGQQELAVRVLSNVVELDLENPELLRVLAKRLLNEKQTAIAIQIFQELKNLRPEEPQSYRDLALAYIENQQYQEALVLFNKILETRWQRFNDIKNVVFNEMNHLIHLHGKHLDISIIRKEYIYPMLLDIRITLEWSSNFNDIDLWVIDPTGEKCFYENPITRMRAKLSKDFVGGYGPEEFTLKTAHPGIYTIYANYYNEARPSITGPVTLYLKIETHYGMTHQKTEYVSLQLKDDKEVREIGQVRF